MMPIFGFDWGIQLVKGDCKAPDDRCLWWFLCPKVMVWGFLSAMELYQCCVKGYMHWYYMIKRAHIRSGDEMLSAFIHKSDAMLFPPLFFPPAVLRGKGSDTTTCNPMARLHAGEMEKNDVTNQCSIHPLSKE